MIRMVVEIKIIGEICVKENFISPLHGLKEKDAFGNIKEGRKVTSVLSIASKIKTKKKICLKMREEESYISALHCLDLPIVDLDQGVAHPQTRLVQ